MRIEGKETLRIWGDVIPGNTGKNKLDDMNVDPEMTMEDVFTKYPGIWDKSDPDHIGDLRGNDFLVWDQEMQNGYAETTYTDVPILVPYICEGSDRCVILCPGGAYLTKSMDSEGSEVAEVLNAAGISAFVLWYRSYPYNAPYMYLDAQRAVRYVRYHAEEYGIDPHKIAIAGFSAGGNLAGVEALCFRDDADLEEYGVPQKDGYVPDEIDAVSCRPDALGLVYPAVSIENDKIFVVVAGREAWDDPAARKSFGAKYDMRTHVREDDGPAFLCACMDDDVVPPMLLPELAGAYKDKGVQCELHIFPYGGHGFGACIPHPVGPFGPPDFSAVSQWLPLFTNWVNRVFQ